MPPSSEQITGFLQGITQGTARASWAEEGARHRCPQRPPAEAVFGAPRQPEGQQAYRRKRLRIENCQPIEGGIVNRCREHLEMPMRIFVQHEPPTDAELAVQVIHAVLGCAENGDVLVPSNCVPSALSP